MPAPSRMLVTGTPGWLGDRLVARLLGEGHAVRCIVEEHQPTESLAGAEILRGDVRSADTAGAALVDVDTVFHCAGVIHPPHFRDYHGIHVGGTRALLDAARTAGARRFLYVSSEAAQGYNPGPAPLTEADPCRPETEYGRTKRLAEQTVLAAHAPGQLETVVIRPAMFYGPGQPARRVRLMRMIASGRPPLFGDGRNRRSMVYVDSVIDALLLARDTPAAGGQLYWIADPEPTTTLAFFESVARALGVPLRPLYLPRVLATVCRIASRTLERMHVHSLDLHVVGESPRDFHCSTEKARRELGFAPTVSLDEGVTRAAREFQAAEARLTESAGLV